MSLEQCRVADGNLLVGQTFWIVDDSQLQACRCDAILTYGSAITSPTLVLSDHTVHNTYHAYVNPLAALAAREADARKQLTSLSVQIDQTKRELARIAQERSQLATWQEAY